MREEGEEKPTEGHSRALTRGMGAVRGRSPSARDTRRALKEHQSRCSRSWRLRSDSRQRLPLCRQRRLDPRPQQAHVDKALEAAGLAAAAVLEALDAKESKGGDPHLRACICPQSVSCVSARLNGL